MASERNALAELAERLNNGYVSLVVNGRQVATFATAAFPELEKAQRIVAELSKVDMEKIVRFSSMAPGALFNLMAACNEIAK